MDVVKCRGLKTRLQCYTESRARLLSDIALLAFIVLSSVITIVFTNPFKAVSSLQRK